MNNSALKTLSILKLLAGASTPLRLRDVSSATGIPKSTALGILRALLRERFVDGGSTGYRLGLRAFEVGMAYLQGISPPTAAQPEIASLVHELGVTAHFAVLDGADVLYLARQDPTDVQVHLASAVGRRLPAHYTAVGQAQLAQLDRNALLRQIGHGPFPASDHTSACSMDELTTQLSRVRRAGYAVDDGNTVEHVRCVAAAVFDVSVACCGAVGVSYLARRGGLSRERASEAVVSAAARASERLGYRTGDAA